MTSYRMPESFLHDERCTGPSPLMNDGPCGAPLATGAITQDSDDAYAACHFGHENRIDIDAMLAKYATPIDTERDKLTRVRVVLDQWGDADGDTRRLAQEIRAALVAPEGVEEA
ncbi:hypothetical protein [Streptomonospora wellingtoniae]|uniref:Uncharacterized protein n=1 Tax=Streptomonospora wellingtoniae TaxID=3075544 RepID=A0ABU2KUE2_9ACTN|nr:hypothetical protein [Streptomonospora sp. DSM 45055]MDT0302920.1 hypothetical protein [Streptomonospora sp. DSM 45055]